MNSLELPPSIKGLNAGEREDRITYVRMLKARQSECGVDARADVQIARFRPTARFTPLTKQLFDPE